LIVDTHAHLDLPEFRDDLDDTISRAKEAGVEVIVCIGLNDASNRATISLAEKHDMIWAAIGVHPNEAGVLNEAVLSELRVMARHPKVVAIGETGLDFYRDRVPRDIQVAAFQRQLDLAGEFDLPVVIHNRSADDETMNLLRKWVGTTPREAGRLAGVLHCFAGDVALAEEAISLGLAISIAGPITYPKNDRLVEVVRTISVSSMIGETDCPFLAPQRVRGRRNEPAYVKDVVERIAGLRAESYADIARITTENARRLFRFGAKN
jgi:TatD DNase family protein